MLKIITRNIHVNDICMIDICLLYIFGTSIMALVSELHVLYFPQIMGGSSPISFGTLLYVLLLIL